jgi:signal transduction histidine kinase
MIKKMRLEFFAVTSAIVFAMIMAFCATILISTRLKDEANANQELERIINDFGSPMNFPRGNDARTFAVRLDNSGRIIGYTDTRFYTQDEMKDYIARILQGQTPADLKVLTKATQDGKIIAAMDIGIENAAFERLTLTVVLFGGGALIILLILVWVLSFWIVRPAVQSYEQQKRFISEASHELKTPLTIISAGAELLQKSNKSDTQKWLDNIKTQAKKMDLLIADLLAHSKLEEKTSKPKAEFDLSAAVTSAVLAFESVAYEQGKDFVCDIQDGLTIKGYPDAVNQAATILCDNAIKYSDDKGIIKISLKKQKADVCLEVSNTGATVTDAELPFLFERFYRGSESRQKTDGSGLGLAILKTLCEHNGWNITVRLDSDKIFFTIRF